MASNFVVVDVGGTKILAAVVTDAGIIKVRHKEKTDRHSKKRLLEQLENAITTVIKAAELKKSDIAGIALGVPGVVETATGNVVLTPNAPLSKTSLGQIIGDRFGIPTVIGNDVNLGVLGEYHFGAAREAHSAFGIFVGTGIGGGLVLGDQLIEGFRGLAGEIGHIMIPLGADEIAGMLTRKHLFLEDLCSRTAIENQLRHAILEEGKKSALIDIVGDPKLERIRSGALRNALRRDDALVTEVMRNASYLLGLATASVLHVVDPEVIVFGGGVIEACGKWMLPHIEKTVRKVTLPGTGAPPKIVQSEMGDDAIILGGVALLRDRKAHSAPDSETLPLPFVAAAPGEAGGLPPSIAQVDKPLQREDG